MESEKISEKAAEYVARKFPNADLGYCSYQTERYKSVFIAGYEQCQKDIAEKDGWHYCSNGFPPLGIYLWFLRQSKFRVATAYTMATNEAHPIAWKKLDYPAKKECEAKNCATCADGLGDHICRAHKAYDCTLHENRNWRAKEGRE